MMANLICCSRGNQVQAQDGSAEDEAIVDAEG
jgi:hypothetical protein